MKLLFAEYLASLRERDELDKILPDLLSELGLNVISRPARGTRQFGVDVGAVGTLEDGVERVYLLSIKPGVLTRSAWGNGDQALRPSLNEIRDAYIPHHLPERFRDLPIVIVLCIGGHIHQAVEPNVNGFITQNTTGRVSYQVWNGDKLAEMLLSGVLQENALPSSGRSDLRKSIALVDEPDAAFGYFCRFATDIADACNPSDAARLTAIRQIYIGLWTLYVWSRDTGNIEAAYRCGERALLLAWPMVKDSMSGESREAAQLHDCLCRLIALHRLLGQEFIENYVGPTAEVQHGLTSAIPTGSYLDVNLQLFDLVGRLGMSGLWAQFLSELPPPDDDVKAQEVEEEVQEIEAWLKRVGYALARTIANNPALGTPIRDSQAIDINIACLLLDLVGCRQVIQDWIRHIARATRYAFKTHQQYPCVHDEYHRLLRHPQPDDDYRKAATKGSLLIPTLATWAAIVGDEETLSLLDQFVSTDYAHSALQLWFPGDDSEEHLYRGTGNHGLCWNEFVMSRVSEEVLGPISSECVSSNAYQSLSAIQHEIWPLVVLACRHHRMPVPPHLWPISRTNNSGPSTQQG